MAEQDADKTEAPTPRRRQEAREQGNIARSPDVTSAALMLAVILLLSISGPRLAASMRGILEQMLSARSLHSFDSSLAMDAFASAATQIAWALAPLLGGIVAVAILANVIQVG